MPDPFSRGPAPSGSGSTPAVMGDVLERLPRLDRFNRLDRACWFGAGVGVGVGDEGFHVTERVTSLDY